MPSLTNCFHSVEAQLRATLGDRGEKLPNMGLGAIAKVKHEAPPRIVWVPTGGAVRTPRQAGGDQISNPRQLWTRELLVEAHIWHVDIQQTEDLANDLMAAMTDVLGGGYKPVAEAWDTQGDLQLGVQCVLTFMLLLPFTDEVSATVKPIAAPPTGQFVSGQ